MALISWLGELPAERPDGWLAELDELCAECGERLAVDWWPIETLAGSLFSSLLGALFLLSLIKPAFDA